MDKILQYFPNFTELQISQFKELYHLYNHWNKQINVISRKDIEHLYTRHVLHSLTIAKIYQFSEGSKVIDVGTGGGFPGIPLAIIFPNVEFTLVDSIGKKIQVVNKICESLQLKNVYALNGRVEQITPHFNYAVSRAVAELSTLLGWLHKKLELPNISNLPNGLIALKGGDISHELKKINYTNVKITRIADYFDIPYFQEKLIVYIPFKN